MKNKKKDAEAPSLEWMPFKWVAWLTRQLPVKEGWYLFCNAHDEEPVLYELKKGIWYHFSGEIERPTHRGEGAGPKPQESPAEPGFAYTHFMYLTLPKKPTV